MTADQALRELRDYFRECAALADRRGHAAETAAHMALYVESCIYDHCRTMCDLYIKDITPASCPAAAETAHKTDVA